MRLLSFESSAKSASVALITDGILTAEYFQNSGQTHSRTLLKMAADLLQNCDLTPSDIDAVASSSGPGSFTGLRIGLAAAKGFAWGREIPCIGVSTLEGMSNCCKYLNGIICACMDARRSQIYNAVYQSDGENMVVLHQDRAISLEELKQDLLQCEESVYLIGDGADITYKYLHNDLKHVKILPESNRMQHAYGIGLAAYEKYNSGEITYGGEVLPNYLRLSQAEREKIAKQNML